MLTKIAINYSPNFTTPARNKINIKYIVFHYTGMSSESKAINRLTDVKSKVSCHYFIKKNGEIILMVPEKYEAWHAGISAWKKDVYLNKSSIGIEISNKGHRFGYENYSKNQINSLKKLSKFLIKKFKIKIVLDCANGSVFEIAPQFFKEIGCDVVKYSTKPTGVNINKNCGAMYPKRIARLTKQTRADIGLSFDGDADRVIISDERGQILDGDIIMAAIVKYYRFKKNFKFKSIVSTYMCNIGFREFLKKSKIRLHLTKVGDRYVIEKMKQAKLHLGGEQSGHVIFSDNGYCGDGILTAMFIINIIGELKVKLSELTENLFLKSPQKLINIKTRTNCETIIKHPQMLEVLKNIKNHFLRT